MTKDRIQLHEQTITGTRSSKEGLRFNDPVHSSPANTVITQKMKSFVRSAYSQYSVRVEKDKEEELKRLAASAEARRIQEKLAEQSAKAEDAKKTLQEKEENLMKALKDAEKMLAEANDLCCDGSKKLENAITDNNQASIGAASKMISMGNRIREEAKRQCDKYHLELNEISTKRATLLGGIIKNVQESSKQKRTQMNSTTDSVPAKRSKTSSSNK